ncbi:MAG: NYN domain-containing protein [Thermoanaerobaculia bacterium]
MLYLVDGSNLLGALRLDREADDAKRELVRRLASYARAKSSSLTCVFDGAAPSGFAQHLGRVRIRFAAPRSADDVLVEVAAAAGKRPLTFVTSDNSLAARVRRRGVEVRGSLEFGRGLAESGVGGEESAAGSDDWEEYFSDPKNRNV